MVVAWIRLRVRLDVCKESLARPPLKLKPLWLRTRRMLYAAYMLCGCRTTLSAMLIHWTLIVVTIVSTMQHGPRHRYCIHTTAMNYRETRAHHDANGRERVASGPLGGRTYPGNIACMPRSRCAELSTESIHARMWLSSRATKRRTSVPMPR